MVAVAWTDLNPTISGSDINYFTTGTAPNRILVVNFSNVAHFGSGGSPVSSQIQLRESDHSIKIHTTSQGGDGGVITMGIENSDGTLATAVPGRNASNWSATNDAWRFALPATSYSYT